MAVLGLLFGAAIVSSCGQGRAPTGDLRSSEAQDAGASADAFAVLGAADATAAFDAADTPEPDAGALSASPAPEGMVAIPAGVFLMGSRATHGSPEERPMHEAVVASFYLDRTEVTTGAYLACIASGSCSLPHEDRLFCNIQGGGTQRANHPINCIHHGQAETYCASLGKRLPTEAEWEYAARGGTEGRRYSWGDDDPTPERACYKHGGTCEVGSFQPGAFGLFDMSGNVWEWTSSWYGAYPTEPPTGTTRVYRGGSWSRRFPKWLTTSMRNRYRPEEWSASVGVRCAETQRPVTCPVDTEARGNTCVRIHGTKTCEPDFAWNGEACTLAGGPTPRPSTEPSDTVASDEPVTRTRTPQHDADCQEHWPQKPSAYRFGGATFHARNVPLNAAGCTRRDMGQTWTSACCP